MYQSHANESPVSSTLNKGIPVTNEPNSPAHVQQEMAESGKNLYPVCFITRLAVTHLLHRLVISDWYTYIGYNHSVP